MEWKKRVAFTGHSSPVYACVADQEFIYSTAGDRFVTRWNLETGLQDPFAVKLDSPAYALGLTEKLLIIGCTNGTVIAIDREAKSLVWEHNFLGKAIFSFADHPAEHQFILGDTEGNLLVVDYSGSLLTSFLLDCGKIRQLKRFDNKLFAACQDGTWKQFELPTFNELQSIHAHEGGVTALTCFPSSHTLLTGGKDAYLRLWDLVTGKELRAVPAHYQTIYGIEQLSSGRELVTVSMDKTIKIWDEESLRVKQRIEFRQQGHNRSVNGCITVTDNLFVSFSDDKQVIVWENVN